MSWHPTAHDVVVAARLRARAQIAAAEIRTLAALSLPLDAEKAIAASKADLECAERRLVSHLDSLELEHLDHWLDAVESQLRGVRGALIEKSAALRPRAQARGRRTSLDTMVHASHRPPATAPRNSNIARPG
jgi:hypothetical protein